MTDFNLYGSDFMAGGLYLGGMNGEDPDMQGVPGAGEMEENAEEFSEDKQDEDGLLSQRQKHKRRSKNDLKGRDFQCGCGKRYLSYPALYTHIKTKHGGQNPRGTNAPQYQSGRGRGRPRKVSPCQMRRIEQYFRCATKSSTLESWQSIRFCK